ncbi:MAG: hypothetical protein U9N81_06020 [Bacillota bacterium]|nr:hypothetical protein [Bacillota bacterium]
MKTLMHRKSMIVALMAILMFVTVTSASALNTPSRGFTPYHGSTALITSGGDMNRISFWNLVWQSYTFTWDDAWEWEYRWTDISQLVEQPRIYGYSQLPGAYFEDTDPNDITFGSHDPHQIVAGNEYDGYMTFTPDSSQPSLFAMEVESEYCHDYGLLDDPYPVSSESLGWINKGDIQYW